MQQCSGVTPGIQCLAWLTTFQQCCDAQCHQERSMALIARFLAGAVSQGVQATLLWYQAQLVYTQSRTSEGWTMQATFVRSTY